MGAKVHKPNNVTSLIGKENINIYPNPANGMVYIDYKASSPEENVKIVLHDLTGKFVRNIFEGRLNNQNNTIEVNIDSIESGVYFVIIENGQNTNKVVKKLIVE